MKAVILAVGLGTRIMEETSIRPKPMVEIGGKPVLWHILKIYSTHGINDFVICCGYKGYMIKEYFANYFLHMSDITFDLSNNSMHVHQKFAEPWKVTLVDTGDGTMTGGRLRRVRGYLDQEDFCFTYGDGLANVDVSALVNFHKAQGVLATVTAVQPAGRFGELDVENNRITGFREKPEGGSAWINGGFFVLLPKVIELISGYSTVWERDPVETLAKANQLAAYRHTGFWQPMDTARDKVRLEELWNSNKAPWKIWP